MLFSAIVAKAGNQMRLLKTKNGVVLEARVKPRSKNFKIRVNHELVIFCSQPAAKGKANRELTKELSKIFGRSVEIVSGLRSKTKRIWIRDAGKEEVKKILGTVKGR